MQLSPDISQVLAGLIKQVAGVREHRKVWSLTLGALASHFEATAGAVFLHRRSRGDLHKVKSIGDCEAWQGQTLLDFFHNRKPELALNTIMAPVRVGGQVVGVLALERVGGFRKGVGREATEILKVLGYWAGCRRDLAEHLAECAVGKAILAHVRPKDITYRILHQLRRFMDYDHGSTVLCITGEVTGRVLARQVAWTKGRSDLVGRTVSVRRKDMPPGPDAVILNQATSQLWDSLDGAREDGSPPKRSIMIGCLIDEGERLGLVEVSSRRPGFFLDKDVATLTRFLPYLAWCVRCMRDNPESRGGSRD